LASQAEFCRTLGQRTIKPGLSRENLDESDPYMGIKQRLNEGGLPSGINRAPT
jgi:hypothetical protein